ncbi:MAG: universal stress protein [Nitrososphaerales archaeon]
MSKDMQVKKILVPIDGSEASLRTAKYALMLANQLNAPIVLLHVISIPQFPRYFKSVDQYYKVARIEAESWFDVIKNLPESKNLKITTKIITGAISVVESIIEYARNEDVRLIIIGTRGRSRFTRLLLGSVASGVVTHADCPVLLVK